MLFWWNDVFRLPLGIPANREQRFVGMGCAERDVRSPWGPRRIANVIRGEGVARDVWLRQVMCAAAREGTHHITASCASNITFAARQIHHFTNVGLFVIIDLKTKIRSASYVRIQITYAFNGLQEINLIGIVIDSHLLSV